MSKKRRAPTPLEQMKAATEPDGYAEWCRHPYTTQCRDYYANGVAKAFQSLVQGALKSTDPEIVRLAMVYQGLDSKAKLFAGHSPNHLGKAGV